MNILSVMAEPNSKHIMCIETAVQQITTALEEEDDKDILVWSGSSESDLSDEDDLTYVAPTLETSYSDTEVTIGSTYSTDYESETEEEDKSSLNISLSAPLTSLSASNRILWTGKVELSETHLHFLKEDIELTISFLQDCTPLHHQKFIPLWMLFRFFSVTILLGKYCCVQSCMVDGLLHNGMLYERRNSWLLLVFCSLPE